MSNNFSIVNKPVDDLIEEHRLFCLRYGIVLEDSNLKLPTLYATPKQHKSPIGFRYITAGTACSLQQLSTYLGVCLKSCLHSALNTSFCDNKFHQRNDYYIIDSNEDILNFVNLNNTTEGFKSINTFDFSTL